MKKLLIIYFVILSMVLSSCEKAGGSIGRESVATPITTGVTGTAGVTDGTTTADEIPHTDVTTSVCGTYVPPGNSHLEIVSIQNHTYSQIYLVFEKDTYVYGLNEDISVFVSFGSRCSISGLITIRVPRTAVFSAYEFDHLSETRYEPIFNLPIDRYDHYGWFTDPDNGGVYDENGLFLDVENLRPPFTVRVTFNSGMLALNEGTIHFSLVAYDEDGLSISSYCTGLTLNYKKDSKSITLSGLTVEEANEILENSYVD